MTADPPETAAALHRAALARLRQGDRDGALDLLHRALAADPDDADIHNSLGVLQGAQGDDEAAAVCFAAATRLAPGAARHFANLGMALAKLGRTLPAIEALSRAESLEPDGFEVRLQLGLLLRAHFGNSGAGLAASLTRLHAAQALRPDHPGANMALATALHAGHRQAEALPYYDRVVALRSDLAQAHAARALALQELDRLDAAIAGHRTALALRPDLLETRCNLSQVLRHAGDVAGARREAAIAIAAHPDSGLAQYCDGLARLAGGDGEGSVAALRRAVALPRLTPEQDVAIAQVRLLLGDMPAGWAEYEARLLLPGGGPPARLRAPLWDGGDLAGRTILIYPEQGLGDCLQFLRFVPMLARRAGAVVLLLPPAVLPLMAAQPGWDGIMCLPTDAAPPPHDVQAALMSLPHLLGLALPPQPAAAYLRAGHLSPVLPRPGRLQVGLAWSGRAAHRNDRNRSLRLAQLAGLLAVPGCDFHVVQDSIRAEDAGELAAHPVLADHHGTLHDFADTAALLAGLDLVVSVDTSVAHLAGALGRPVWLLLPAVPDWRWQLGRADSPWYAGMRLFRQPRAGDWAPVLRGVAAELASLA